MHKIPIYCKCQQCDEYFGVTKRRKYCTRKCRDAHYYDTKSEVSIVKRYKLAKTEAKEWMKPLETFTVDDSNRDKIIHGYALHGVNHLTIYEVDTNV